MFKQIRFRIIGVIILLAVIISGVYYLNSKESISNQLAKPLKNLPKEQIISPFSSPTPFYELTIPYLRSRGFNSSLGELKKLADNIAYISYLTSYDSDGLKINGLLTIPKGSQPDDGWPAIVFVHGYIPPNTYKTTSNYVDYVDYLAKSGFVVFKIDLRGHDQSQGEAGGGYYSSDYIIDTLNAYNALQNADFVDQSKIGLWGHSMAGNTVFRSFVARQNIPAVVIWAGAVYTYQDMSDYHINDNSYRPLRQDSPRRREREKLREIYGDFNPENEFWKQVVPTNFLNDINGAIQINHAIDDPVVSIEYSKNIIKILDQTNIVHQFNQYPSGGHNISSPSFSQAMENTISFFHQYLK